jgi:hypothetical protein
MFYEDHPDSIRQRGLDEALACRDMLEPTPVQPSLLARAVACFLTSARTFTRQRWPRNRRAIVPSPTNSGVHRRLCWGDLLASRALSDWFPPN